MKIRQGFVSNSSSSSFLLYIHGPLSPCFLNKALGIDVDSPIGLMVAGISDVIIANSSAFDEEELTYEHITPSKEHYDLTAKGWKCYRIDVCNDSGNSHESLLYDFFSDTYLDFDLIKIRRSY